MLACCRMASKFMVIGHSNSCHSSIRCSSGHRQLKPLSSSSSFSHDVDDEKEESNFIVHVIRFFRMLQHCHLQSDSDARNVFRSKHQHDRSNKSHKYIYQVQSSLLAKHRPYQKGLMPSPHICKALMYRMPHPASLRGTSLAHWTTTSMN